MSAERVVVTRAEMRQIREHVAAIKAAIDAILQRPEPESRGWIQFEGSGVIELPDSPDDN
jgi:hypothetical protein